MRIRRRTTAATLALVLLALPTAACVDASDAGSAQPTAPAAPLAAPSPAPSAPQPTNDPTSTADPIPSEPIELTLQIADPAERQALATALQDTGDFDVTQRPDAQILISDIPLDRGQRYDIATWAAVVHQRHDVLDLSLDALRDALSGRVTNWQALGGSSQPITVLPPDADIGPRPQELAIARFASSDHQIAAASIADLVASLPGALAIVPIRDLRPGLLPLVIDGHDPLRDPAAASPLVRSRWIAASDPQAALAAATALSWIDADPLDPLGLVATGDYIPTRCVGRAVAIAADGDFDAIFDRVGDTLRTADVALVSMEVAATGLRPPTPCLFREFILTAGPEAVDALAASGVDVVTTAGNHAGDCFGGCRWRDAMLDTIEQLDRAGLAHAGTGETLAAARTPAIIERGGTRLAVLSYDAIAPYYIALAGGPGTAPAVPEIVAADVRAARDQADHVIVAVSWGVEYVTTVSPAQRAVAAAALAAGASLVVGNHPHWVQPIATTEGAITAFALGNFVFDQSWSIRTTQSVLLEVGFTKQRILGYRVRPVVIRHDYQPELVDPSSDEGRQILGQLWAATDRFIAAP